jgi:hypothetical protein
METFDKKEAEDFGLLPAVVLQAERDGRDVSSFVSSKEIAAAINYLEILGAMKEGRVAKVKHTENSGSTDRIYKLYPTKCPVSKRSSGKSKVNKRKIASLLNSDYTEDELTFIINKYVVECRAQGVYMKNFSTFLNNIPDYTIEESEEEIIEEPGVSFLDRFEHKD